MNGKHWACCRRNRPKRKSIAGAAARKRCSAACSGLISQPEAPAELVGQAVTENLAGSETEVLLINLADLWGEHRAQNVPGTVNQHPNWRLKSALSLEEIEASAPIKRFLGKIDRLRKKVKHETSG